MLISNRVNTFLLVLLVVMAASMIAILASRSNAGPLDPAGPPSPTGTLPQVEPRSPIPPIGWNGTSTIIISQPGSYFLTRNLDGAGQYPIQIAADRVTLDLNGFTLTGTGSGSAISDNGIVHTDVVIRNGSLTGWDFAIGGTGLVRSTFEDLRVTGNANGLEIGSGNTVRRVTATENTYFGVRITQQGSYYAGSVTDSNLSGNGPGGNGIGLAIQANNITVRNNVIDGNQFGVEVLTGLSWLEDNDITGNVNTGIYLGAAAHQNTIVRNFITINTIPVNDIGGGNDVGAFTATASSSDVWSNIVY